MADEKASARNCGRDLQFQNVMSISSSLSCIFADGPSFHPPPSLWKVGGFSSALSLVRIVFLSYACAL